MEPGRQRFLLRVPRPLCGLLLYLRRTRCRPSSRPLYRRRRPCLSVELQRRQSGVHTTSGHQLGVGALLHQLSVVQHHN